MLISTMCGYYFMRKRTLMQFVANWCQQIVIGQRHILICCALFFCNNHDNVLRHIKTQHSRSKMGIKTGSFVEHCGAYRGFF